MERKPHRPITDFPTLNPAVRAVPSYSRVDDKGRPLCIWCNKRLRFSTGWGFEGEGLFCNMRHAAEWANIKASALSDDWQAG